MEGPLVPPGPTPQPMALPRCSGLPGDAVTP